MPNEGSYQDLQEGNERVVSVLHNVNHYLVLVIEMPEMKIYMYDGL